MVSALWSAARLHGCCLLPQLGAKLDRFELGSLEPRLVAREGHQGIHDLLHVSRRCTYLPHVCPKHIRIRRLCSDIRNESHLGERIAELVRDVARIALLACKPFQQSIEQLRKPARHRPELPRQRTRVEVGVRIVEVHLFQRLRQLLDRPESTHDGVPGDGQR